MSDVSRLAVALEALADAVEAGADEAEVYSELDRGVTFQLSGATVEWRRFWDSWGLGLRVIQQERLGYAYTSDCTPAGIRLLVGEAMENGAINEPDPFSHLPDPDGRALARLDLAPGDWDGWPLAQKTELLERAHRRTHGPRTRALCAEYGDGWRDILIVNSRGIRAGYATASAYIRVEATAESGQESQAAQAFGLARHPARLEPEAIAQEAALRAEGQLGGRPAPTGRATVVLSPLAGCQFFAQFARGLSGEAVVKGRSPLATRLGDQIGPPQLTLRDDPLRADGPNSRPVDAEGVSSRVVTLMSAGRLTSFLHTTSTGARSGHGSTASARRSSYRSTPEAGAANVVVVPGGLSEDTLLDLAGRGLYVEEFLGLQASSAISGRYSAAIVGRFIEGGRLAGALSQAAVAGSFDETLPRIQALGDHPRFFPGAQAVACPAVLIDGMAVAGK